MKRLLGVALILSLVGSSAVMAAPYGNRGYGHGNNDGAVFAGLGIVALAAILASQHNNHYQYGYRDNRDGYDTRNYGGYNNDYGRSNMRGYDERQSGYGYSGR
jgi:hypothetical protein